MHNPLSELSRLKKAMLGGEASSDADHNDTALDCNHSCNVHYSPLLDIPWRVYCKKACNGDGESWEECLDECKEMCYKDPVYKEYGWSASLDRSPGSPTYSLKCQEACVRGCAFKFIVSAATLDAALPRKPPEPPENVRHVDKPEATILPASDVPSTSA